MSGWTTIASLLERPVTRPGHSSLAEVAGISPCEVADYVDLAVDAEHQRRTMARRTLAVIDPIVDQMAAISDDPAQLRELLARGLR